MALEFFLAKNSMKSARANGVALHSAYNPEVEGQRFAQGLKLDFNPKFIVIMEGALSYCAPFIKKIYNGAKVGCVRFSASFSESDKEWDFVLCLNDHGADGFEGRPLSSRLFDLMGEEGLFQSAFFDWKPSADAWPNESKSAWEQTKEALEKAKAVLATREHFGKRWLKNKVAFFSRIQKTLWLKKTSVPVLICASGPSLEGALESIKKVREKIFVCALSSAISVLERFDIRPDLALSADGGWWAKRHLYPLKTSFSAIPLAIEAESACPSFALEKSEILPLCYDDDTVGKKLYDALGAKSLAARRNGTVSGSALELFLTLTSGEIYFAGLDLSPSKSKSHASPNILEKEREAMDYRLMTKATRQAAAALPSESLKIYEDWFKSFDLKGRKVFRIEGEKKFLNSLGQIQDISAGDFAERLKKEKSVNASDLFERQKDLPCNKERRRLVKKIILDWSATENFYQELFPADSILLRRAASKEDADERKKALEDKKAKTLAKLFGGKE